MSINLPSLLMVVTAAQAVRLTLFTINQTNGTSMHTTKLGRHGPAVSALGLGCMGMSPGIYGQPEEAESIATIRAAVEAGITLLDTGDLYGMGHNELLIQRALADKPAGFLLAPVILSRPPQWERLLSNIHFANSGQKIATLIATEVLRTRWYHAGSRIHFVIEIPNEQ
jgi:Aldo/keto reductase family